MQEPYHIDYLIKNVNNESDYIDTIKFLLDLKIYNYGDHLKSSLENYNVKKRVFYFLNYYFVKYKIIGSHKISSHLPKLLSSTYFEFDHYLNELNYLVYRPTWSPSFGKLLLGNNTIHKYVQQINKNIYRSNYNTLLTNKAISEYYNFKDTLIEYYSEKNILAIFLANDIDFFSRLNIKIFKELNRPSFIFQHGLPSLYNDLDDSRGDYLLVWGDKIKENYIKAGRHKENILVVGHPSYGPKKISLKSTNLENVLVLTKACNGAQFSDKVRLNDRGNSITYLYSIQNALKTLGVRKARLRPHPSENPLWYLKFVDTDFYQIDNKPVASSLNLTTLVIGPASSLFLQTIYHGINYIIYEPVQGDLDLMNLKPVAPFDGTDSRVQVAKNEEDLLNLLKDGYMLDPSIFYDYVKMPFDIKFLKDIIK